MIVVILGVRAMLEDGVNVENAPTLLIVTRVMTVPDVLLLRQDHSEHVHFMEHSSAGETLIMVTRFLLLELLFALFGLTILAAPGYVRRFVTGKEISVDSSALVCPGDALSVLSQLWIN